MKKTKQLFVGLMLLILGLGTLQAAEECPSQIMEGSVCLPKDFPVEPIPGGYTLNLTEGHTQISHDVYDLHMLILWICVLVGVGVFGVMFYSVYHHRKSRGHVAAQFHENTLVEIVWTVIPAAILIAMAIPATKTMMEMEDVKESDMTIKVTGWQWKWEYDYLDKGIHFFSNLSEASNKARKLDSNEDVTNIPHYLLSVDEPLVVPTNKKIRFVFTASDVLHSWWVPALGWKKDAIPGFINEAWASVKDPGIYRGQCTELCGKDHAFMPVVVIAMEQDDYDAWAAKKIEESCKAQGGADLTHDELVSKGAEVYANNCATCHMPDGVGVPGAFPALKGSSVVNGDINAQANLVINGKNAMPAFGKQLSATDIAAAITYTRNALGNFKGDEIQPKDIKAKLPDGGGADDCAKEAKPDASAKSSATEPAKSTTAQSESKKVTAETESNGKNPALAGKASYETNCSTCHQKDGGGMPPMFPALKGSAVVNGDIRAQAKLVINGKNSMPAFGKKLSADELAKVITYTRNALGNSKGDSIRAKDIETLLSGGDTNVSDTKPDKAAVVKDEKTAASDKPAYFKSKAVTKPDDKIEDVQFAQDKFYPQKRWTDHPGSEADNNAKFKGTLTKSGASLDQLAAHGESVFEKNCQSCHQKEGVGMPPMFPALQGSPVVTGKIDAQIQLMLKGKGAMPAFGKTLSAKDFAGVLAYTRNKIGNNATGDFKSPTEIAALQSAEKP